MSLTKFHQVVRTHCQNVPVQIARVVGRLVPVPKLNCPHSNYHNQVKGNYFDIFYHV